MEKIKMNQAHQLLVRYIMAHPEESLSSIARLLNTTPPTITRICQQAGLPPRGGKRLTVADVQKLGEKAAEAAEANNGK
jgi:hypothetical protein